MAADLDALTARIRRTIGDVRGARFDSAELITPIINSAMRELAHITQKYNVIDAAFSFTAPGPEDLPADFIGLNRIRNSDDNPLWRIDFRDIKQWNVGTSTTPNFYAIKAKKLYLVPSPSSNVTIELDYIAVPADLSAGSDELDASLGPFAEAFVVAYASRELSVIGQDFEAAQVFTGQMGTAEMKSRDWANTEEMFEGHQVYSSNPMVDDSRGRGWLT